MKIEEREKILSEYEENKQLVATAEKRLAVLRERIMTELGSGQYGKWIVIVSDQERESFSLKEARAGVTPSVWEKIQGFVKKASFKKLTVEKI